MGEAVKAGEQRRRELTTENTGTAQRATEGGRLRL